MKYFFKNIGLASPIIILSILILSSVGGATGDNDWHEIKNREGIRIFSRKVEGSSLLAFKGVATINTSIGTVINVINDKARHKEWVMRLAESGTVSYFTPLESVEYTHVHGIWPISDRDVVFHSKAIINQSKGEVVILMHSVDDPAMPEREGIVRAQLIESKYVLTEIGKKQTLIEAEFHGDPKGWIPAWIANFFQKSWPFDTLKGLKEQSEKLGKEGIYRDYNSLFEYYLPLAEKQKDHLHKQQKEQSLSQ